MEGDLGDHRGSRWRRNGVVGASRASSQDVQEEIEITVTAAPKLTGAAKLVLAGAFLWVVGALIYVSSAFAQTPAPTLDPTVTADALAGWGLKLYKAAQLGEWRTFFSALLVGVVGILRWATKTWKSELETHAWYREVFLPLMPVILALLMSVGVDLGAGKSVGMSIWRGLNIGLMAGGGYKVWRIVADNAKKLIATPHA